MPPVARMGKPGSALAMAETALGANSTGFANCTYEREVEKLMTYQLSDQW